MCEHFPQDFLKPIDVLEAVDANVNGQWEDRLQQAGQNNIGEHIVLIPYYMGSFHWSGILILFKGLQKIQQAEFIDPVSNSQFTPGNIETVFNKLYPGITLSLKKLRTHNDPKQSKQLIIQNLLQRVKELQTTDPECQQSADKKK